MTEDVFGIDTDADQAARLMNQFIRKDWIEMEPALYRGKWFDYRFMNPVQATYLYAHHLLRIYRMHYSRNISSARGEHVQPVVPKSLFELPVLDLPDGLTEEKRKAAIKYHSKKVANKKKLISGVWRGRQTADAIGMPYDVYLESAFHWTLRFWQQRHLPRPYQLYTELVTDRASVDWYEKQGAMLYYSELPQYRNEAYEAISAKMGDDYEGRALQSHNAHHEWLLDQAERRHNSPELIARLIWQHQVLPETKARARLGDDEFQRVAERAQSMPCAARYN